MQRTSLSLVETIRFRHFKRTNWALFATLHKVVIICVLSVSTLTHARAASISTRSTLASDSLNLAAEALDEIEVLASAPISPDGPPLNVVIISQEKLNQIASAPSVIDVLKGISALDVRQRGPFGVQADIGIRGSNFDAVGISINGVPFSSPQTGHNSSDLPLSNEAITAVEVIKNGSARGSIPGAMAGTINYLTPDQGTFIRAKAAGGSFGTADLSAVAAVDSRLFHHFLAAEVARSDGATDNSAFSLGRIFIREVAHLGLQRLTFQGSFSFKQFGANTFYGNGSAEQWEALERISGAITAHLTFKNIHLSPQFAANEQLDHYQWIRHSPAGENYHATLDLSAALNGWTNTAWGRTSWGVCGRRESVLSTSLGRELNPENYVRTRGISSNDTVFYTHSDVRWVASAYLSHAIHWHKLTASLTINAIFTSRKQRACNPSASLSYRLSDTFTCSLGLTQSLRLPTFTDLYYSGVGIQGTMNLRPERNRNITAALSFSKWGVEATLEGYFDSKKDMIDWVQFAAMDDDIYRSTNFRATLLGFDLGVTIALNDLFYNAIPLQSLSLSWTYNHQKSRYPEPIRASKYAFYYLRNKLTAHAHWLIATHVTADLDFRVYQRRGNDNPSYCLLDARFAWQTKYLTPFISLNNVLNRRYYDYSAVPQPRMTFLAGVFLDF